MTRIIDVLELLACMMAPPLLRDGRSQYRSGRRPGRAHRDFGGDPNFGGVLGNAWP